ncbi:hypothetical protein C5C94_02165 [Rathayibacter sp. AY1C3]|nr:hypothetical protein C5B92_01425 [Rathayibacter sp. AY1A4]PPG83115.1 hypothetical protein C5C52_03705 [Rathayibacter sp. AY1E5]PPH33721.1 hypothetical protein C5C94_02165 [Rathayibacter sp. AY1C3]PPH65801.1 hypothetical protein C5D25_03165 [Rathayibacter sp. AY1D7]PPI30414.1 hypothetical protein C5D66_09575 [Rathayibacter sp. AY1B4]
MVVVAFSMQVGMWILEAFILFAAHGALRLTALLGGLAKIVDSSDRDAAAASTQLAASSLIPED